MHASPAAEREAAEPRPTEDDAVGPRFDEVYESYLDFVWQSLRRLGVQPDLVEDAAHDVFVVVFRRLADFEGRSSIKTWLFGIAMRVARQYGRNAARDRTEELSPQHPDANGLSPQEGAARQEAAELLYALLQQLDEGKRAVFILAELEQFSAPQIAQAMGLNPNTVYTRLRAARREFAAALSRHQARDTWRQP